MRELVAESGEPIFLVGFARSGTTWINQILRDYLDVGLVNEGGFIVSLGKKYKPSEEIVDLERFVRELSQANFFRILKRVYGISIDWKRITENPESREYSHLVKLILSEIAEKQEKRFIGSKSPGFGWNMDILLSHFPNCKVIHLIRDGRDCALSHYQLTWGRKNAFVAASRWQRHISLIREGVAKYPVSYIEVRYEDILRDPTHEFERLQEFILPGNEYREVTADIADEFALSVGVADIEEKTNKWKNQMSKRDKKIFETVAGNMLDDMGYEVMGTSISLPAWLRAAYVIHDKVAREFLHARTRLSKRVLERKGK